MVRWPLLLLLGAAPVFAAKVDNSAAIKKELSANKTPRALIDQVVAWRADAAKFAADEAAACPVENPAASACPTVDAASWQVVHNAGIDNLPQGVLAQLGSRGTDKNFMLRKLDPAKLDAELAKESNTYIKSIWIEKFYEALAKNPNHKNGVVDGSGHHEKWLAMDEGYKNVDAMKALAAFDDAWVKIKLPPLDKWKPTKLPECDGIESTLLKLVPTTKEMTRQELFALVNKPEIFELMRVDAFCALLDGNLMKARALEASREMFSFATHDQKIAANGSLDYGAEFRAPFGKAPYTLPDLAKDAAYFTAMNCNFTDAEQFENNDRVHVAGGEIAAVKDTPQGTLVSYKKSSWTTDDMQCDYDNTLSWSATGVLERGKTCTKKGTKTVASQEDPQLLPKGTPGIKVGAFVTTSSALCAGQKHGDTRAAFPLEVYPDRTLTNGSQRSYLWWPIKPTVTPPPIAPPPVAKKSSHSHQHHSSKK